MENEPLRIGRVTRATERTLGISLTGSVMIYIENEMLDSLAEKHPDTYLTHIQEIGAVLTEFSGADHRMFRGIESASVGKRIRRNIQYAHDEHLFSITERKVAALPRGYSRSTFVSFLHEDHLPAL